MIGTLEEAESACAAIEKIAEPLLKVWNPDQAKKLIEECRRVKISMSGKFGNVSEQLGRICDAAILFRARRLESRNGPTKANQRSWADGRCTDASPGRTKRP